MLCAAAAAAAFMLEELEEDADVQGEEPQSTPGDASGPPPPLDGAEVATDTFALMLELEETSTPPLAVLERW